MKILEGPLNISLKDINITNTEKQMEKQISTLIKFRINLEVENILNDSTILHKLLELSSGEVIPSIESGVNGDSNSILMEICRKFMGLDKLQDSWMDLAYFIFEKYDLQNVRFDKYGPNNSIVETINGFEGLKAWYEFKFGRKYEDFGSSNSAADVEHIRQTLSGSNFFMFNRRHLILGNPGDQRSIKFYLWGVYRISELYPLILDIYKLFDHTRLIKKDAVILFEKMVATGYCTLDLASTIDEGTLLEYLDDMRLKDERGRVFTSQKVHIAASRIHGKLQKPKLLWSDLDVRKFLEDHKLSYLQSTFDQFQKEHNFIISGEDVGRFRSSIVDKLFPNLKASDLNPLLKAIDRIRDKYIDDMTSEISEEQKEKYQKRTIIKAGTQHLEMDSKNLKFLEEMVKAQGKKLPVISIIGPVGVGKSHLSTELMHPLQRILENPPLAPFQDQNCAITGNLGVFVGEVEDKEIIIIDSEGFNGGIPALCDQEFLTTLESRGPKRELAIAKRSYITNKFFPQVMYCVSDILIYVDTQPLINTKYCKRLIEFVEDSVTNVGSANKPDLIIVQNMHTSEKASDMTSETQTDFFLSTIGKTEKDIILNSYKSINVMLVPNQRKHPKEYIDQIEELIYVIGNLLEEKENSTQTSFGNLTCGTSWLMMVQDIVKRFQNVDEEHINLSRMIMKSYSSTVKSMFLEEEMNKKFVDLLDKHFPEKKETNNIQRYLEARRDILNDFIIFGIKFHDECISDKKRNPLNFFLSYCFDKFIAFMNEIKPCCNHHHIGRKVHWCVIQKYSHYSGHRYTRIGENDDLNSGFIDIDTPKGVEIFKKHSERSKINSEHQIEGLNQLVHKNLRNSNLKNFNFFNIR